MDFPPVAVTTHRSLLHDNISVCCTVQACNLFIYGLFDALIV